MMTKLKDFLVILLVLCGAIYFMTENKPLHPDVGLNVAELIVKYGYPLETHEVLTKDGYLLTLHRIPHGLNKSPQKPIPMLLMHGLMNSATEFVSLGPGKALSLLLADRNYDIWLGNARGTTWSRKHIDLNPDTNSTYWDFSLHEIGVYDVPAIVDYILKVTEEPKLHYVGYSQGSACLFILLSERPEYADKIRLMTALAPPVFLKNAKSPIIKFLINFKPMMKFLYVVLNIEWLPANGYFAMLLKHICDENSIFLQVCLHQVFILQGYNEAQLNKTLLPLIMTNLPAGASYYQIHHLLEMIEKGTFAPMDWGADTNLKKYGRAEPNPYNLTKVTPPVALYYANNDWTVNADNIPEVVKALPNVVMQYLVPLEKFTHFDFLHAMDAPELLYNTVIEVILRY